jgi:hypothetical protein
MMTPLSSYAGTSRGIISYIGASCASTSFVISCIGASFGVSHTISPLHSLIRVNDHQR